jgi:hypothetical protein
MYLSHTCYALKSDSVDEDEKDRINLDRIDLGWKYEICFYYNGRYNETEILFDQMMKMRKRMLSAEHSDTLISMANLASTYRNQGR